MQIGLCCVLLSKSQSQVEIPYYVTLFNTLQGKTILNLANLSLEINFFPVSYTYFPIELLSYEIQQL